jgi:hypothetical protein
MRQEKGGAIINSGIPDSGRKYYVGNNWAYNINSSIGAWDETHRFAETRINGKWWLIIKPIRGRTTMPGHEIKVWYPWKKSPSLLISIIETTRNIQTERQDYNINTQT